MKSVAVEITGFLALALAVVGQRHVPTVNATEVGRDIVMVSLDESAILQPRRFERDVTVHRRSELQTA